MPEWTQVKRPRFLAAACVVLLALELAARVKLGTIFMVGSFWLMAHQGLALKLGKPAPPTALGRFMTAWLTAMVASVIIFVVFGVGNGVLRSLDPAWRFFQLP